MHIVLIAIILCLLFFIFLQMNSSRGTASVPAPSISIEDETQSESFAFISNGKLFCKAPGEQIRQIHSPFIQNILDEGERRSALHGWKKGTSFDTSYIGKPAGDLSETAAMSFKTAEFLDANTMLYFLSDGSVGGLFEQDLTSGMEKRILHQQGLDLDHFHFDADGDRILCSSGSENGIRNLSMFDRTSNNVVHYTEGDTIDSMPCSYPGHPQKVVMQTSGIGRNEAGYIMAVGPASLNVLSTDTQQIEPVIENDQFDFMQPLVHPNGDLYYIRRPFETPTVGTGTVFLDIVLFPFRIARAFFHYLNFFSLMYSKKPLTTAAGPEVQRDRKEITIQGKRIDAERAQRRAGVVRGVPSLVPNNWKLMSRNKFGEETVEASHVISFDLSADGQVYYTNGFGVFKLSQDGPELLFRDSLIEQLIVS